MFCTEAGRRREWLVSLGALLFVANENISSKCSIGIDKFMDRVHAAVEMAAELNLLWVHQYTARERVWNDPLNWDVMRYDRNFEPIVVGETMYLAFSDSDKVVALDTESGEENWKFYTDGPVRLPPAVWDETLYATSDDGYLYCLNAATCDMNWKFQAAPGDRKVLGNNRLISTWPARGGVVVEDGRVYFAASIFPMMGTFIYCLDAGTGGLSGSMMAKVLAGQIFRMVVPRALVV